MSIRSLMMAVAAASVMLATPVLAETGTNPNKSNTNKQAGSGGSSAAGIITVNGSKSNTFREGSTTGASGPAASTTVKSSKSNGSE